MPPSRYARKRLTNTEVIRTIQQGTYTVDTNEGTITSPRTGKHLFTYRSSRSPNRWVRIYHRGRMRALPIAHLIWMVGTGDPLPRGYEVHHHDRDPHNNAFSNLIAVHPLDHNKLHNGLKEEVPF